MLLEREIDTLRGYGATWLWGYGAMWLRDYAATWIKERVTFMCSILVSAHGLLFRHSIFEVRVIDESLWSHQFEIDVKKVSIREHCLNQ